MAHLYGIRPWEWDGGPDSKMRYGLTLAFCRAIDRHRAEMAKGAK